MHRRLMERPEVRPLGKDDGERQSERDSEKKTKQTQKLSKPNVSIVRRDASVRCTSAYRSIGVSAARSRALVAYRIYPL